MKPLILINFKTYPESSGDKALELAKQIAQVKTKDYQLAIAPSLLTTKELADKTRLMIFAQHADGVLSGAHTGHIPASELREIGVKGVILNHSEYKIPFLELSQIIELCKAQWLITLVCASTISEVKHVAEYHPDYIAYEPEELIGGNVSVVDADAGIITKAIKVVQSVSPKTKVLCGAGIHSKEDLQHALALGAEGVLLAHAVVKAGDPKKFMERMVG